MKTLLLWNLPDRIITRESFWEGVIRQQVPYSFLVMSIVGRREEKRMMWTGRFQWSSGVVSGVVKGFVIPQKWAIWCRSRIGRLKVKAVIIQPSFNRDINLLVGFFSFSAGIIRLLGAVREVCSWWRKSSSQKKVAVVVLWIIGMEGGFFFREYYK